MAAQGNLFIMIQPNIFLQEMMCEVYQSDSMVRESPFILYVRCNPGATGIEIIEFIDTIDTFNPDK